MISIKKQKIISYIPLLNAAVLFIWLHNYRIAINNSKIFAKSLLVLFASTIPLACFYRFLLWIYANSNAAVSAINTLGLYFVPFIMARCLIRFQISVLSEK